MKHQKLYLNGLELKENKMRIEDIGKAIKLKSELERNQEYLSKIQNVISIGECSLRLQTNWTHDKRFSIDLEPDEWKEFNNKIAEQIKATFESKIEKIKSKIEEL